MEKNEKLGRLKNELKGAICPNCSEILTHGGEAYTNKQKELKPDDVVFCMHCGTWCQVDGNCIPQKAPNIIKYMIELGHMDLVANMTLIVNNWRKEKGLPHQ